MLAAGAEPVLRVPLQVAKARANGIAALSISNSVHFAALWWEVERLASEDGLVSMAFVNSKSFGRRPHPCQPATRPMH